MYHDTVMHSLSFVLRPAGPVLETVSIRYQINTTAPQKRTNLALFSLLAMASPETVRYVSVLSRTTIQFGSVWPESQTKPAN